MGQAVDDDDGPRAEVDVAVVAAAEQAEVAQAGGAADLFLS